jgi:TorA maturation chaperone TorD
MTTAQTMMFESQDQGEETARADLYGVLASLFSLPASQQMLDEIAASDATGDAVLEMAWIDLVNACKEIDQEAVREEYEYLFIGVGKPEVMLYGSYYLAGFLMEKPLALLRTDLAALGIERADAVVESEDHIGTLCEVMRYLIASDDIVHANLAAQRQFFADHMQQWVLRACDAIEAHPDADFYRHLARLARAFFEVEMLAFDMA